MRVERDGNMYVAHSGDDVMWTVELELDMNGTPFRGEKVWPAAAVVAIGGGRHVCFLAEASGAIVKTLPLGSDLFGHFSDDADDVLYILGWRRVVAIDRSLTVRWVSKDIAIDGITWRGQAGKRILLSAEMDPPGGWVDVELDAATGHELSRGRFNP